jgi:hypothetical protein
MHAVLVQRGHGAFDHQPTGRTTPPFFTAFAEPDHQAASRCERRARVATTSSPTVSTGCWITALALGPGNHFTSGAFYVPPPFEDMNMGITSQIREHMDVISSDRKTVGKVDHLEGTDKIKLTKQSSPDGEHHHFIPVSWVDHVDQHVHLNKSGADVTSHWQHGRQ